MSDVWFFSDLHAYHKNIAGPTVSSWASGYRNFDSIEEMNEVMFANINEVCKPNDKIFFGGDWSFGGFDKIKLTRDRINCKNIVFILGNHDHNIHKQRELFSWVGPIWQGKINGRYFFINHFAQRVWEHSHHDSIHLYGHSHGTLWDDPDSFSFDIGMDTKLFGHAQFTPYHYDEVIYIIENFKNNIPKDHHTSETN